MHIRLRLFIIAVTIVATSFSSCEYDQLPDPLNSITRRVPTLEINYTTPPISGLSTGDERVRYRYAEDLAYSDAHRRNALDIFTLTTREPSPLVIYIHSGGFISGDKAQAYDFSQDIRSFLTQGIAFATINYRFLEESENGVMTCLEDIRRAVQFLRYHAKEFNIDPNRVSCYGVSAGAGASLWLATHEDMADIRSNDPVERQSTRIRSAVAIGAQASYDLVTWEDIFEVHGFRLDDPNNDQQSLFDFYNISSVEELYTPEMTAYRKKIDMLGLFSADDAPVYVMNNGTSAPPTNNGELYHHPFHAAAVKEAAEKAGVENQIYALDIGVSDPKGESPLEFTVRHLKE
ncbi:MAG: alpha/beta hydrolase [Bacteroidota bacterium]